jgi:hypothetical protein
MFSQRYCVPLQIRNLKPIKTIHRKYMSIEISDKLKYENLSASDICTLLNKKAGFCDVDIYISTVLNDTLFNFTPSPNKLDSSGHIYVEGECLDIINKWAEATGREMTLVEYEPHKRKIMVTVQRF